MGICPLLTSCVDSDMYEMYDEDGLFIPRTKKNKDLNGDNDGYPTDFLSEANYYPGECAACCYDNFYHVGYEEARKAIIIQYYGKLTKKTIAKYYKRVQNKKNVPYIAKTLLDALTAKDSNWKMPEMDVAFKYIVNNGYSCDKQLALVVEDHVGMVSEIKYEENNRYICVYFVIKDQYPSNSTQYQRSWVVPIDKRINKANFSQIKGFIWYDK